jgi:restriction system protein
MKKVKRPTLMRFTLLKPVLEALNSHGGTGSTAEINEIVAKSGVLTPEEVERPYRNSGKTEFSYEIAWTRTYLKLYGAITQEQRGIWTLTETGRNVSFEDIENIPNVVHARKRTENPVQSHQSTNGELVSDIQLNNSVNPETEWKDQLLNQLLSIEPSAFERLCQRLLYAAGFERVVVTGRTGDGGIDGEGWMRLGLVTQPIVFQSKRYKGSVGSEAVRGFRGAMHQRTDRGLLITTGYYTQAAIEEARRVGIDLIDGDALCEFLREFKLGISTATMIDEAFFKTV